jgi:hypothetical protein
MKRPEDIQLSREEGEALLARLEANTLTAEDRRVLGKVLTYYFWLLFALREAKLSLKRLKALVCGEKPKPPKPPVLGGTTGGGSGSGNETQTSASQGVPSSASPSPSEQHPENRTCVGQTPARGNPFPSRHPARRRRCCRTAVFHVCSVHGSADHSH